MTKHITMPRWIPFVLIIVGATVGTIESLYLGCVLWALLDIRDK